MNVPVQTEYMIKRSIIQSVLCYRFVIVGQNWNDLKLPLEPGSVLAKSVNED